MSVFDDAAAFKIMRLLVKPFDETEAYRLGIIDSEGHVIVPIRSQNNQQKEAFTLLVRLTFNIKKLINKLPGGQNRIKNLAAGYLLMKESYNMNKEEVLMEDLENKLSESELVEDAPANNVGSGAIAGVNPNDIAVKPRIKPKKLRRYEIV